MVKTIRQPTRKAITCAAKNLSLIINKVVNFLINHPWFISRSWTLGVVRKLLKIDLEIIRFVVKMNQP